MSPTRTREPSPYLIPLDLDGDEVLSVDMSTGTAGWAAYFSTLVKELGVLVLLRLAPEAASDRPGAGVTGRKDAALEVKEMRVTAGQRAGFASALLREIPILRIEAAINQTIHRRHLIAHVTSGDSSAADLPGGARYRTPPSNRPSLDRQGLLIQDPGGYRKPDEFYQRVADLFLHQAAISPHPAQDLAAANNVPVATVHRWIREAKTRRLLLLPAHRGGQP